MTGIYAGLVTYFLFGIACHWFFRRFNPKTELMANVDWMMVAVCYIGGPFSIAGFCVAQVIIEMEKDD